MAAAGASIRRDTDSGPHSSLPTVLSLVRYYPRGVHQGSSETPTAMKGWETFQPPRTWGDSPIKSAPIRWDEAWPIATIGAP